MVRSLEHVRCRETLYAALGVLATLPGTAVVAAVVAGPPFYRYGFTAWTAPALVVLAAATVDVRFAGRWVGFWGRRLLYGAALLEALTTVFYSPVGSIVYLPAVGLAFAACRQAHRAQRWRK